MEHMFEQHAKQVEASPWEPVAGSPVGRSSLLVAPTLERTRPELARLGTRAAGAATVRNWVGELARVDGRDSDVGRIESIRALEELKSAAAAAQARLAAAFAASQRAEQRRAGLRASEVGRGIGTQVALARRESPHRGGRLLGLAEALVHEMPRTMAALTAGETNEWRATVVARETACLPRELRQQADRELGGRLAHLGDRETEAEARRLAYRLDPAAFVARRRGAEADRRVTLRPAPDTMSRLGAFLPVAQGVAAYTALTKEADRLRALGDERGRGQLMADLLVQRVTGQASAAAVPVEVHVVMTDTSLFGNVSGRTADDRVRGPAAQPTGRAAEPGDRADHDEPAEPSELDELDLPDRADHDEPGQAGHDELDKPGELIGFGPVPASWARDLVREAPQVWLRRLYLSPETGELVAMDSRRRIFPRGLRRFLVLRDQVCRNSWCGAPIRHSDHVIPAQAGGRTSADNGQGLCEACNLARQAPGMRAVPGPGGSGESVTTTTPTGHEYTSRPPPLPGARSRRRASSSDDSPWQSELRRWLAAS
ncbi:MAG: hypothetical protein QOJ60_1248 [Actinomycetota bacterium]|nr:hypothetical protein [Actinomycetota bacterium]